MNTEIEKYSDQYTKGMLISIQRAIYVIEGKIAKIKAQPKEHNTPRQISTGGKLTAFNQVLQYLKDKEKVILEYRNGNADLVDSL